MRGWQGGGGRWGDGLDPYYQREGTPEKRGDGLRQHKTRIPAKIGQCLTKSEMSFVI